MPSRRDTVISPLIADVITASFALTQSMSNALIDSQTSQNETMRAELDAIRARVGELLDGPYAPSESAIRSALWPSSEFVDLFREDGESR